MNIIRARMMASKFIGKKTLRFSRIFVGISFLFLLSAYSCTPLTKDSYMERYADFIDQVTQENKEFSEKDWSELDEKYHKLSETWRDKFEEELTTSDKSKLLKYDIQYQAIRAKSIYSDFMNILE